MSKKEVPTYEEWLKERQNSTNENRARAEAFLDTAKELDKAYWKWLKDIYLELHFGFKALEWVNNYRIEGDFKIYQELKDNQERIDLLFKTILGFDSSATETEVVERAKELGCLIDNLIDKKRHLDEVIGKVK